MKLSFSDRKWTAYSFDELLRAVQGTGVTGIELYSVRTSAFGKRLDEAGVKALRHQLRSAGICPVCIDSASDADAIFEAEYNIGLAKVLGVPFVRLQTSDKSFEETEAYVRQLLPAAEADGVVLLIETVGVFADTARLRELLNRFASDFLAALWDIQYPYMLCGETPETTVCNLGAYIRHVHCKDSVKNDDGIAYCLVGEGALPIPDVMRGLASLNYDGYLSLEWDPAWIPEVDSVDVILTHFASCMSRYGNTARALPHLYENRAHTGKFLWRKDALIRRTFPEVLDAVADEFPDQYAFRYTTLDYTRTYAEFRADVDDFARALIALGVGQGSHVAVWATNLPQWYIAFWATTKIGAVLVSMNTAYKIHEAEYLLRQSDTYTLILEKGYRDSDYDAIIHELCPELDQTPSGEPLHSKRLPFLRHVITIGFRRSGCLTWEEASARSVQVPMEELRRRAAAVTVDDVCNMQYTSGTTGFPKGVMLTHYNVVNNGKCIGDRMDLSTADRMMIQVPMFHCFGMVLAMTAAMTHGATLCPLPYFSPRPALACIHSEHITAFHGVPTMFIALMAHPDFAKTDFSYMRTGIMAGSPCPISVMRDVVEKMHMSEITIVYGQTEASPGCTMSSTDDSLEVRVGTVGRPLPEIECKIVSPETGEELPDGETGEFVARGYNIMKGYYKMPGATAQAIDRDGWLHTGDLACRNPDGNFRITGRLKDMIIRGGENIYPKEIEEFIYTHPQVKDVQVIGVPDEQYGEEIMACIILKEGSTLSEEAMRTYILDHMARHKVPKYIRFVEAFPMNVAGKILKYKMREDAIRELGLQKADSIVTA